MATVPKGFEEILDACGNTRVQGKQAGGGFRFLEVDVHSSLRCPATPEKDCIRWHAAFKQCSGAPGPERGRGKIEGPKLQKRNRLLEAAFEQRLRKIPDRLPWPKPFL